MEKENRRVSAQEQREKAWCIELDGGAALSGATVANYLGCLAKTCRAKKCRVYGVEGGGETLSALVEADEDKTPMELAIAIPLIAEMVQVDWADIFVGPPLPTSVTHVGDGYVEGMIASQAFFRCVDGSYVNIYGLDVRLGLRLQHEYPKAAFQVVDIASLIFPR